MVSTLGRSVSVVALVVVATANFKSLDNSAA
jgi:hypothetical protein